MQLQPSDIEVGCVLRPRHDLNAPRPREGHPLLNITIPGIPCQWTTLVDRSLKINPGLNCIKSCVLNPKGQEHPVVVIQIKEDNVSYVQMTSSRLRRDWGSQYSPIGHYFPLKKDDKIPHPQEYRSRYWLRVHNFSHTTIDENRAKTRGRTIKLQRYSKLRLPHVFTQPLSNFEAFGGDNSKATQYSLDKASYYRLMDRLGIGSCFEKRNEDHMESALPAHDHAGMCDSPNNYQPSSQVDLLSAVEDKNSRSARKLGRLISIKVHNWLDRPRTI
ncbi:hypothetical protein BPAE_0082g00150 [Botrytis paeoniae]|uniref:Uncharacterized protein n=1 Tax=Botrytis paeoniae TaxID=278948 RepID=A0A4Z1FUH5_9HELO|nr:hypothetical protein BPAE_0082g00150 [Botrytis paeoniae]